MSSTTMPLTTTQRRLRSEIQEIASLVSMDHWAVDEYEPEARTTVLRMMKQHLVRGEIVVKYALVDELLSTVICQYFFRKPGADVTFRKLWRTKKFRIFNHYIMDESYLLGKERTAHAISAIPKDVRENIGRINALRNALAHSFFPENRRQYMRYRAVLYRGSDIYSKDGIEKFEDDFEVVRAYLFRRAFGAS